MNVDDTLPLSGCLVVNTRPEDQAEELTRCLETKGAEVVLLPLLCIRPCVDRTQLLGALARLTRDDWVVFTSANGSRAVADELSAGRHRITVVGERTAEPLRARGLVPDRVATAADSAGVAAALIPFVEPGKTRVLLLRGDSASRELPDLLAAAGALLDELVVYESRPNDSLSERVSALAPALVSGGRTVITLTSSKSSDHLAALLARELPGQELHLLQARVPVVAVGARTGARAEALGFRAVSVAASPTTEKVAEEITRRYGLLRGRF